MNSYVSSLFSVEGKVAIVTGASRGLGQAMALALSQAGAIVVAVASSEKSLANTKEKLSAHNPQHLFLPCDQSDAEQIADTVNTVFQTFGRIDILVNNAGIIRRAPAEDHSDQNWLDVMNTNATGVFRFCRAVGKIMLEQGNGKIINIASLLSFSGGITVPSYAASKGAVAQLTKALANEWANKGIQVNAIAPGYFATDNTEQLRNNKERNDSITARIPSGEWGQPSDLNGAALFLSSKASDYVNGHILLVDGGWMAR
ncbi:2-dehydro-3-deoxy-D-gluconate 5-dehydrogenase KduD [Thalassotalea litorea]|uniref:2-dehydro-3-deoxy-D-gluconate 5-dehydrogenase KduD n=1 Tax=Thalassotalea litorea TaxID=2020715 RepID=A0A5R9IHN8_9GAMM|nr:2-dehydro-3-deoxy-D-gluconate 5-dehydrogenase KduD [Thalassotalea litorea]TLU59467.1 2-dehydro-3-deoxy-D-gluconate 5-dehydrogenase KduD [Thalassotalea litorea]